MGATNSTELLKPGTLVRVRNSGYDRVLVAEYRGPFGPKGARIYSVLVDTEPENVFVEFREDQLELLDTK